MGIIATIILVLIVFEILSMIYTLVFQEPIGCAIVILLLILIGFLAGAFDKEDQLVAPPTSPASENVSPEEASPTRAEMLGEYE